MYVDTSVIIKLLVPEPDTEFYAGALGAEFLTSSELAKTEVRSALLAKQRKGELSASEASRAWQTFIEKVESQSFFLHLFDSALLKRATWMLERCHPSIPLRTLDAIHLAACDLSRDFPLCTNDKRMRDAAVLLGIPVFPE